MAIALYKNTFDKDFKVVDPYSISLEIMGGAWKDQVMYLRSLKNEAEYKNQKQNLPAVTWSGVFNPGTRSIETLKSYSGLICLDVDKLEESTIKVLKEQLIDDPYTISCFVSPSGKGVKIIVKVDSKAENHRAAFLHLQDHFEKKYLIKIDGSGKDVSRLCYLSYDPESFIKNTTSVFNVDLKYGEIITSTVDVSSYKASKDTEHIFKVCVGWVNKTKTFVEGERNVYLHVLACALNRCGVDMETAIQMMSKNFPTPDTKWHQSIRSAYFHHQAEHATVEVKDMGTHEFVAPPYIANYTDDVAANDLMSITAMLFHHKVQMGDIGGIVAKIAKYYKSQGYIDVNRASLRDLMNKAIQVLQSNIATNAEQNSLKYESAEDLAAELVDQGLVDGVPPTTIPVFDSAMRGGLQIGNFYGLIGVGGTFKSIIAQFWAFKAACLGHPVLYLNGEMSKYQFYERLVLMSTGINFYKETSQGNLTKENIEEFINKMKLVTKNNIFFFNGNGYNKTNVNATLDHITATTGKKVKLIIMDGVTQMDNAGREEIPAAIMNTGICKEIAKTANGGTGAAVIGLMHISGEQTSAITRRDNGSHCRGGGKTIANMDGYFSTSLLIDPEGVSMDNPEDIAFRPGKVYVRLKDKRSPAGVISAIVNISPNLHLEYEDVDPRNYEFKVG